LAEGCHTLKGTISIPRQITNVIENVRLWLSQDAQCEINHVYCEANIAADWLSKFGHLITVAFSSSLCFPPELQNIIKDDVVGCTLVKREAFSVPLLSFIMV